MTKTVNACFMTVAKKALFGLRRFFQGDNIRHFQTGVCGSAAQTVDSGKVASLKTLGIVKRFS